MYSEQKLVQTSKFLSLVLRHQPELVGLALDREGWVGIDALIAGAAKQRRHLNRELILAVVANDNKKRFSLSGDGLRIRAAQGHSTASVAISYTPLTPPATLYHGTATRFLESIRTQGLKPGSRHYVHLSQDLETAQRVGARHGRPVVLTVAAETMHAQGFAFFQADNGVWLTAAVPPEFFRE